MLNNKNLHFKSLNVEKDENNYIHILQLLFEILVSIFIGLFAGTILDTIFLINFKQTKFFLIFFIFAQFMLGGIFLFGLLCFTSRLQLFNQNVHEGMISFAILITVFFLVQTQLTKKIFILREKTFRKVLKNIKNECK